MHWSSPRIRAAEIEKAVVRSAYDAAVSVAVHIEQTVAESCLGRHSLLAGMTSASQRLMGNAVA